MRDSGGLSTQPIKQSMAATMAQLPPGAGGGGGGIGIGDIFKAGNKVVDSLQVGQRACLSIA